MLDKPLNLTYPSTADVATILVGVARMDQHLIAQIAAGVVCAWLCVHGCVVMQRERHHDLSPCAYTTVQVRDYNANPSVLDPYKHFFIPSARMPQPGDLVTCLGYPGELDQIDVALDV